MPQNLVIPNRYIMIITLKQFRTVCFKKKCLQHCSADSTSAISSLSGLVIATGLNNCFRLSGSFCLPPYPLPAGFIVTKIPVLGSRLTCGRWGFNLIRIGLLSELEQFIKMLPLLNRKPVEASLVSRKKYLRYSPVYP